MAKKHLGTLLNLSKERANHIRWSSQLPKVSFFAYLDASRVSLTEQQVMSI